MPPQPPSSTGRGQGARVPGVRTSHAVPCRWRRSPLKTALAARGKHAKELKWWTSESGVQKNGIRRQRIATRRPGPKAKEQFRVPKDARVPGVVYATDQQRIVGVVRTYTKLRTSQYVGMPRLAQGAREGGPSEQRIWGSSIDGIPSLRESQRVQVRYFATQHMYQVTGDPPAPCNPTPPGPAPAPPAAALPLSPTAAAPTPSTCRTRKLPPGVRADGVSTESPAAPADAPAGGMASVTSSPPPPPALLLVLVLRSSSSQVTGESHWRIPPRKTAHARHCVAIVQRN